MAPFMSYIDLIFLLQLVKLKDCESTTGLNWTASMNWFISLMCCLLSTMMPRMVQNLAFASKNDEAPSRAMPRPVKTPKMPILAPLAGYALERLLYGILAANLDDIVAALGPGRQLLRCDTPFGDFFVGT